MSTNRLAIHWCLFNSCNSRFHLKQENLSMVLFIMDNMSLETGMKSKWDNFGETTMDTSREIEMKMEWDSFEDDKPSYCELEAEKEVGEGSFQETDKEEDGKKLLVVSEDEEINNNNYAIVGGYNKDLPPIDDVCPICFDRFTVPCRSNCGHWFCASCILELWKYRSSIQPCKCPLCWCMVVNLKPENSLFIRPADDTVQVLRKVDQYNGLFVSGVHGFVRRVLVLPLLAGRIFSILIHPDGLRCIYYVTRLLGLLLAVLYERGEYEFIPTGGLGIQRTFDMAASLLVLIFFVIGAGYRWVLRSRRRGHWELE